MASTWLPVTLLGHCMAVFQPCDGLTFYPVQVSRLVGKGSMGRFPDEDTVNTQEPGMSEITRASFALAAVYVCFRHLDGVSTPYPQILVRFTHSIAFSYVIPLHDANHAVSTANQ